MIKEEKESKIKTITYKKGLPDAVMTKLANLLGDNFINCEKIKGQWVLTYWNEGKK